MVVCLACAPVVPRLRRRRLLPFPASDQAAARSGPARWGSLPGIAGSRRRSCRALRRHRGGATCTIGEDTIRFKRSFRVQETLQHSTGLIRNTGPCGGSHLSVRRDVMRDDESRARRTQGVPSPLEGSLGLPAACRAGPRSRQRRALRLRRWRLPRAPAGRQPAWRLPPQRARWAQLRCHTAAIIMVLRTSQGRPSSRSNNEFCCSKQLGLPMLL